MDQHLFSSSRVFRFIVAGAAASLVSYVVFIAFMRVAHFSIAALLSWLAAVSVSFALNRKFTFGISGKTERMSHLKRYFGGSLLQLLIAIIGYWILIDRMRLGPSLAFAINLIATTSFSYLFLNLIVFRRRVGDKSAGLRES